MKILLLLLTTTAINATEITPKCIDSQLLFGIPPKECMKRNTAYFKCVTAIAETDVDKNSELDLQCEEKHLM